MANGGMVRGQSGYWEDSVLGAEQLTCKEVENELLEIADNSGIEKTDRAFQIKEVGDVRPD